MSINITLVDDHPMVIEGLKQILLPYTHIKVISTFTSGKELLVHLKDQQPDVLILDILMPELEGTELAEIVSKEYPHIKIMAITSLNSPTYFKLMMKSGCTGYLLKNTDPATLVHAIEQVAKGEEYIDAKLKDELIRNIYKYKNDIVSSTQEQTPALTRREKEIIKLVIQDELSNQEIAEKLFLSIRTVENHRFNINHKLGVKNNIGLMKVAIQLGILSA